MKNNFTENSNESKADDNSSASGASQQMYQQHGGHAVYNKNIASDTQQQQSHSSDQQHGASSGLPMESFGPNNQYGSHQEHFMDPTGPVGYSRPSGPEMSGKPMMNYGPGRFPTPQSQMSQPGAATSSFDLNAAGAPKYPGHGMPGEYPMGQYRPDGPSSAVDMYNNQQPPYWNNQMRMNYPGAQSPAAYRHQVCYGTLFYINIKG